MDQTLGTPRLQTDYPSIIGFFAELIICSCLIYVFLVFSSPAYRDKYWIERYAFARAGVIGIGVLFIHKITGCALNPFPIINGSLISASFPSSQWIYVLSAILSVIIGGVVYQLLNQKNPEEIEENIHEIDKAMVTMY